jgi:ABC-2 type transport system ATP-binding protein
MSAIEVRDLRKNYGITKALDGITFDLKNEEVLAFLGPNGAGKSTTMKIITCYMASTSGQVRVNGMDVAEQPLQVREIIGYLPETTPLYENMIVLDFLKFAGKIHNIPGQKLINRISEMADVCGINEVMSKRIHQLSKGYKQRVGLAYAMLHDPQVLILDEPTAGLDPNQIVEIRNLIKELGKKKSVILSTHILSEAEATAQRAVIIDRGKIVAEGTVDEIKKNKLENQRTFLSVKHQGKDTEEISLKLRTIDGIKEVMEKTKDNEFVEFILISKDKNSYTDEIYSFCKNEQLIIKELKIIELTLEDVFKKLTKREV